MDGVPILINEANSIFTIASHLNRQRVYFRDDKSALHAIATRLPRIGKNWKAAENYKQFASLLQCQGNKPLVLVLGGGVLGMGMESLAHAEIKLVNSDVALTSRTEIVLDAHDIPFEDEMFDGVIVQAVLEHVVDPYRCVEEMHRVLKKDGLVYAEIPFMQQVHGGGYDFTRFTHLGLVRLFRKFDQIDSGACCGPGMALAWSVQYFWLSFTTNRALRLVIKGLCALMLFPLKYADYWLVDKPGGLDAASACFFLGRKAAAVLDDKTILKMYRGAV